MISKSKNRIVSSLFLSLMTLSMAVVGVSNVSAASKSDAKKQLETNIDGSWRAEANRARDKYRHPLETLSFFGVRPDATLIELIPGPKLWYAEILAPFLHDKGHYIAANVESDKEDAGQKERLAADPERFGKAEVREFDFKAPYFGPPNSADFFLTFRNIHNFARSHDEEKLFQGIFNVLKPGGILGVVDHRAAKGVSADEALKYGYIPEDFVIAAAEKAGFKLVAASNINNNAKDTKDYPKGVWTLPPTLREGETDREKYLAIGESDRFTLKFVKP